MLTNRWPAEPARVAGGVNDGSANPRGSRYQQTSERNNAVIHVAVPCPGAQIAAQPLAWGRRHGNYRGPRPERRRTAKAFGNADAILGDFTFKRGIGPDPLEKVGPLKIKLIQQPSVGYEHIDIKACSERGIPVANTPGANTVSVAEHTIALGLAMLRKLIPANRSIREGQWL
jgi:phosphoglycerate dehydrogenase-like enzyme